MSGRCRTCKNIIKLLVCDHYAAAIGLCEVRVVEAPPDDDEVHRQIMACRECKAEHIPTHHSWRICVGHGRFSLSIGVRCDCGNQIAVQRKEEQCDIIFTGKRLIRINGKHVKCGKCERKYIVTDNWPWDSVYDRPWPTLDG